MQVPVAAPALVVLLGERRLDLTPSGLESGARLLETGGGPAALCPRFGARIEADAPAPLIGVRRGTPARTPIAPIRTSSR